MSDEIKLTKLSDCAGCAAKVGAGTLAELLLGIETRKDERLLVGFDTSDDAAVYQVSDELALVQTLDFFPPIDDDPYWYGKIAAVNALSDVYAMGGEPKTALNILCIPKDMPKDTVHRILAGGYEAVYEAGAVIAGGHSILDSVPKYGLSVTGFVHPKRLWKNCGARPGDMLILTKPLGVGVLTTAARGGLLREELLGALRRQMTTLNKTARDIAVKHRVHACTDVTGFGLLGHLYEMALGSDVSALVDTSAIQFLPESVSFAQMGILPEGAYRNRSYAQDAVDEHGVPLEVADVLYTPETSGGLLLAVEAGAGEALLKELEGQVPCAQSIGVITPRREKRIILC